MPGKPRRGICDECEREMDIPYHHPETKKPICPACYQRGRRRGKKIEQRTRPVQNPVSASHPEIRHPEDLMGKEVMDLGSSMVGIIVRVDFFEEKEVEVDFDGARRRYCQRELSDLVLFTKAIRDFREERLAADRKPGRVFEKTAKRPATICQLSDLAAGERVMTKDLRVAMIVRVDTRGVLLDFGEERGKIYCDRGSLRFLYPLSEEGKNFWEEQVSSVTSS